MNAATHFESTSQKYIADSMQSYYENDISSFKNQVELYLLARTFSVQLFESTFFIILFEAYVFLE